MREKTKSILLALFVTFLWSTSWVLIKVGLEGIPAITFAGLRYFLAFIFLLIFLKITGQFEELFKIKRQVLLQLILLGVFLYALTQGAQFLGLYYLPTVYVSIFLNFTPLFVLLFGRFWLDESTTKLQIVGIVIFLSGVILFFYPLELQDIKVIGLVVMMLGVFSNAVAAIFGRKINKSKETKPLIVTTVSMGVGAFLLLGSGIIFQGFPVLSFSNWAIILWLSLVNTAFAFTLWNKTLQHLEATESSIINGTMLIQISILAWIFLGEDLQTKEILAILVISVGAILVQLKDVFVGKTKINNNSQLGILRQEDQPNSCYNGNK